MNVERLAKFEQHVFGDIVCPNNAIMVLDILLCPLLQWTHKQGQEVTLAQQGAIC